MSKARGRWSLTYERMSPLSSTGRRLKDAISFCSSAEAVSYFFSPSMISSMLPMRQAGVGAVSLCCAMSVKKDGMSALGLGVATELVV